jgi:predicted HTH transcriptional regulator
MGEDYFRDQIFHGTEERNLEYKRSMLWGSNDTKEKVVIACLAMANTPDGGTIVFGVDEDKEKSQFFANGMLQEHAESFKQDNVSDYVNRFADPYIDIKVSRVVIDTRIFVTIQVQEYQEYPIVCKLDGQKIKCGDICVWQNRNHPVRKLRNQPSGE